MEGILRLRLLGPVQLERDGEPVRFQSDQGSGEIVRPQIGTRPRLIFSASSSQKSSPRHITGAWELDSSSAIIWGASSG